MFVLILGNDDLLIYGDAGKCENGFCSFRFEITVLLGALCFIFFCVLLELTKLLINPHSLGSFYRLLDQFVRVCTSAFLELASLSIDCISTRGFTLMGFEAEQNSVPGLLPLFGAIFMSNTRTMEECLTRELFGLPSSFSHFVKLVRAGMILFLFDHEKRLLHGVFRACSNGALNIVPDAYRSFGRQYPAQVKMTQIWRCSPLSEDEFCDAIKENYFSAYKFRFGLSEKQVHSLLALFDMRKLKDIPLERLSTRINSSSKNQCSVDSKRRYIDDNRCKTKERIIDKRYIDDDHVWEIPEDSLRFMERDKVYKEQKVSDEFFPDISTKDYHLRCVHVGNNSTFTNTRSVRYDYDKNIERVLTPAEHSHSERFRRSNDGRIDKLVSEYSKGYDFIPLSPVEQPHLVPSDFGASFFHDKSFLLSDQFRTTSVDHCDTESQNFIPLNLSYSGDEMEERSRFFNHNAHRNRYPLTGVGHMSTPMENNDYAETMIPSLRNSLDSVRVKLIDRWQGESSHSSDNLYRAKYLDHRDKGVPKILNDRTLSTSESFSSLPQLETVNNWMENKVQFISPSKYAGFSFCSPLPTQDREEHQRVQLENEEALFHGCVPPKRKQSHGRQSLDCDIEYQTSKSEPFEDPNRSSVFSRLTLKKSDKDIGYEEQHYNNSSADDIMAVLRRSSCMWRKSRIPTLLIQNLDDDENLKKKRKDFSHELEVKEAFLTEKESDYPIPEETVFLDFKRRSQSGKSSDNLNPNNQTKSVDADDISRSGQRKKRKLVRPNFHESGLFHSDSNLKVQSSESCVDKVKVEISTASRACDEYKDTVPGNVELLRAGCEGDSGGRNGNSPNIANFEVLQSTNLINAGGPATEDITPIKSDSKS